MRERENKMTDSQLDHSLTSMEWLYRIGTQNKQLFDAANNKNFRINIDTSSPSTSSSNTSSAESCLVSPFSTNISNQFNTNNTTTTCTNSSEQQIYIQTPNKLASKASHSAAQRAEPHRPIDLNAEYKGGDHNRREGKPPYSYVNLITFAINSNPKKRMTLNEIYQWISENFHFYKNAGNGWKVSDFLVFLLLIINKC